MKPLVEKVNSTLRVPLTLFMVYGLWAPNHFDGLKKRIYNIYTFFSMMLLVGIYIIIQVSDLFQVWGNVSLMTATMFLIFTNFTLSIKILNVILKKKDIQIMIAEVKEVLVAESTEEGRKIIARCDRETSYQLRIYTFLTYVTIFGVIASAEENQLPIRAWYPYDTSKNPAYQLTYAHQCIAIALAAGLHICLDTLDTTLIRQCRCHFQLLALSLTTLCDGVCINKGPRTIYDEQTLLARLRQCIKRHQTALDQVDRLQEFFSTPIFCQFSVSMFIICVTAYQLAFEPTNFIRSISMVVYLIVMMLQVFVYCYQASELLHESEKIKEAAYQCPWYACTIRVQRIILVLTTRCHRVALLRAGGLIELSIDSFMAIIKTSYTLFTVLQCMEEKD